MTVHAEVEQLLGDAVEKLAATAGEGSAEEVVGEMLDLLARLTVAVEHVAARVDELARP